MYFWKNTILNFSHVGGSLNCFANYGTISSLTWINGNLCIVLLFFSPSIFSPTLKQNTPTLGNDFAERKNSVTLPVQRKNGGMFTFHWNSSNWFFSVPLALYWQGKIFFFFNIYSKNWINVFVTSPSISLLSDLVQGMDRLRRCKISGLLVEIDPDFHSCTVFLQGVPACTV